MPRKPTQLARIARSILQSQAAEMQPGNSFPTLAELSDKLALHPSTVFRLLRDLAAEGVVWQSPSGKFFPASAQRQALRGAPVCFIGREVWQWSRLYQEVLEGISEVCATNESPLIILSSRILVRQPSPTSPPTFASRADQIRELDRLLPMIPKPCGGLILDHLWADSVLVTRRWPATQRVPLFRAGAAGQSGTGPDPQAAADLVARHLRKRGFQQIALVLPFCGDPAIDTAAIALRKVLSPMSVAEIRFPKLEGHRSKLATRLLPFDAIVCPEDNIAQALSGMIPPQCRLIGTQGTGLLQAPHTRIRYDLRRLGRNVAASVLHGNDLGVISPTLIEKTDTP